MKQQTLYGIPFDYMDRYDHSVQFSLSKNSNVILCELELNMIENNSLPYHLPMKIEQIDEMTRLYYPFSGKRMLAQELKLSLLTQRQYGELCLAIISALENAKQWMLNENHFVLNDRFIFVEPNFQKVSLVYLPLEHISKHNWRKELADLIVLLLENVNDLQGNSIQKLLRTVRHETSGLKEIKQSLMEMMSLSAGEYMESKANDVRSDASDSLDSPAPLESPLQNEIRIVKDTPSSEPLSTVEVEKSSFIPDPVESLTEEDSEDSLFKESTTDKLRFHFVYLGGLHLIYGLLSWRLSIAIPTHMMKLALLFGYVIVVCGSVIWIFYQRKKLRNNAGDVDSIQEDEWEHFHYLNDSPHMNSSHSKEHELYTNLSNQTTVLGSQDEPVVGDDDSHDELPNGMFVDPEPINGMQPIHQSIDRMNDDRTSTRSFKVWLELQSSAHHPNAQQVSIHIPDGGAIIGRDEHQAQIQLPIHGLSRLHAELLKQDEACYILDLGSSNGTTINGERAVPYKRYRLQDGDLLRFVNETYVFRCTMEIKSSA